MEKETSPGTKLVQTIDEKWSFSKIADEKLNERPDIDKISVQAKQDTASSATSGDDQTVDKKNNTESQTTGAAESDPGSTTKPTPRSASSKNKVLIQTVKALF